MPTRKNRTFLTDREAAAEKRKDAAAEKRRKRNNTPKKVIPIPKGRKI